jgi:hypothetical protein
MMIPLAVFSSAGAGSTNTLSANGFNNVDITLLFLLVYLVEHVFYFPNVCQSIFPTILHFSDKKNVSMTDILTHLIFVLRM